MLEKIIGYLERYLIICIIVYYTFIEPMVYGRVRNWGTVTSLAGEKITINDSLQTQAWLYNVSTSSWQVYLEVAAFLLLGLIIFKCIREKIFYKKQLIVSTILLILAVVGVRTRFP